MYNEKTGNTSAKGKGMFSSKMRHFMDRGYYLHNWVGFSKCFKQFILIIIVNFVLFCFQKKKTNYRFKAKYALV